MYESVHRLKKLLGTADALATMARPREADHRRTLRFVARAEISGSGSCTISIAAR